MSRLRINKYWVFQLLGWLFLTTYFLLGELFYLVEGMKNRFFLFALYYVTGIAGTHVYYLLVRRRQIFQSIWRAALAAFVGSLALAAVFFIEQWLEIRYILKDTESEFSVFDVIASILLIMRNIVPWFFCFHIYKYSQQVQQANHARQEVEFLLRKAELDNLKRQLQPHFLFNALNSIRSLMISDVATAREALTRLAEILRSSLNILEQDEIVLQEELDVVENYMAVEKLRYEERLHFEKDIRVDASRISLPPFCVQALIENSVKHGIARLKNGGKISLKIFLEEENLNIEVINDGALVKNEREGLGLVNLKRRLQNKYGNKFGLQLEQVQDKVVCKIRIEI